MKKTVKQMIEILEKDGWEYSYTKGDHHQFKHPTKKGKVTIRGRQSDDLSDFLVNSVLKQAGLK